MTRLPRSRKGKTPIDVTTTNQKGLGRVRLTVGKDQYGTQKLNSDLDPQEVMDLLTILTYHLGVITGQIEADLNADDDDDTFENKWIPADETGEILEGSSVKKKRLSRALVLDYAVADLRAVYPRDHLQLATVGITHTFVDYILLGKNVIAINLYRQATGLKLRESKLFVESLGERAAFEPYESRGI